MKNLKGKITITRPSGGHESCQYVNIVVKDDVSRKTFISIEVDPAVLMTALMGLSAQEVTFSLNDVDVVGKTREIQPLKIKLSLAFYNSARKESLSDYIFNHQDLWTTPGWTLDPYLGSQRSIEFVDDKMVTLNCKEYRYVGICE